MQKKKLKKKLIVMGGSFNPPTIAHLKLMQTAVESIQADKGMFVPTGRDYVARKMKRQKSTMFPLGETLRLEMLKRMCGESSRLDASDIQMRRAPLYDDYGMLLALQEQYPAYSLFFVIGSDKLHILPKWREINLLLRDFHFLVARRNQDDAEQLISNNPCLAAHRECFDIVDIPEEIASISSSAFREKLVNQDESARDLVTPSVWQLMKEHGAIPWEAITDFHADGNDYLSNFYEASVTYDGLTFGNNEAAFQAQKSMSPEEKARFTEYNPSKSKSIGRHIQLRPDWEKVKYGLMEAIVRAKFQQHPELAQRLLSTGTKTLVEGNTWGDTCWGVDSRTGEGENFLGKILMKIRSELA